VVAAAGGPLAAPPRYDSAFADEFFATKRAAVLRRQAAIAAPLTAFVGRVVLDYQLGRAQTNRRKRAREFLAIISGLGPAFIKAGQALASRPDLLPTEYLEELQKLQDRVEPFGNEEAMALVEAELGRSIEDVFESVGVEPVAAASIGQVYKATLKGSGKAVAVKIQRPKCEEVVAMDIYILRNLSGVFSRMLGVFNRDINLQSIVEEFGKLIYEEIDYLAEAKNAIRFKELYGKTPQVVVPDVYLEYSTRRLIVMEWIDGVRLTSKQPSEKNSQLVQTVVQCSLRQILSNGFFHADPHGGNLLATSDGQLCYLDFGMMSEVTPEQRYGIIEAVVHLVNQDYRSLASLYSRLGFLPPGFNTEPIVIALEDALPDVLSASVEEFNFKSVIDKLGAIFFMFPFSLPPYYTAILRCLGVLEGVAIQVDPKFKIINNAYPFVASQLLSESAPELENALQSLLFSNGKPRWSRLENLLEGASDTSDDFDLGAAAEGLLDFVLSPRGAEIRYTLADSLVNEIDLILSDSAAFYTAQALQSATAPFGVRLPFAAPAASLLARLGTSPGAASAGSRRGGGGDSAPDGRSPRGIDHAERLAKMLRNSRGVNPEVGARLARRVAADPEGMRIVVEIAVGLAERATARALRLVFGLPMRTEARRGRS